MNLQFLQEDTLNHLTDVKFIHFTSFETVIKKTTFAKLLSLINMLVILWFLFEWTGQTLKNKSGISLKTLNLIQEHLITSSMETLDKLELPVIVMTSLVRFVLSNSVKTLSALSILKPILTILLDMVLSLNTDMWMKMTQCQSQSSFQKDLLIVNEDVLMECVQRSNLILLQQELTGQLTFCPLHQTLRTINKLQKVYSLHSIHWDQILVLILTTT